MSLAIKTENLWKKYRLGVIGYGTLQRDLQSWWARVRGKEDPNAPVNALSSSGTIEGDTVTALRDVCLEVERGEILGIIGGNGAGKTTLLKIITGLTAPTKGVVKIKGRVGALLAVGTGMHPELTGRENVFLNGAILGMTRAETAGKFDQIVDFSGVEKFIDTPVKRYSNGMNVRLGFAVAAHLEPEILLIDEVLAVGDIEFQKKCLGKIDSVAREGRTVLFVSHNMLAVQNLCHRAIVFERGGVVFDGEPRAAIDRYLSSYDDEGASSVDLSSTPNRNEGSLKILRRIDLFVNGSLSNSVPMGSIFEIKLGYDFGIRVTNPGFRLFIEDGYGSKIAELNPSNTNPDIVRDPPVRGFFRCVIPNLNLRPGRYYVSIVVYSPMGKWDRISRACRFDVVKSDVFGTARLPREGIIFLESDWDVESQ
ncbi:ABC transporter ATP-binding protein [Thermodesulfobacteriota bacterium]